MAESQATQGTAATQATGEASGTEPAARASGDTGSGGTGETGADGHLAFGEGAADEGQAEGDKAKAKQSPAGELDIKIPEGFEVDAGQLASFKKLAADVGLTADGATKLVAWQAEISKAAHGAMQEAQTAALKKTEGEWMEALKHDPDFGGTRHKETMAVASRALTKYGDKQLAADLVEMGLSAHPGLIKLFARVGRAMGEDRATDVRGSGAMGQASEAEALQKQYPSMFNADGTQKS